MKTSQTVQGKLTSSNDNISAEAKIEPQVTKITRKVVTSQPVTETYVTKRVITTTTKVGQPSTVQNTRYNNISSSNASTINKSTTNKYSRPAVQTSTSNNRYNNNNINNRSITTKNQVIKNSQRPVNQNYQQSRIQNSQSYSGNRNQPKRPNVSTPKYKPRATSPSPGSLKRRTINRGKPVQNVQITHIIYSSQPLNFHIIEDLNMDNLNTQPIQISAESRNNLQKNGIVQVTCSCDNIKIKTKKPADLTGTLTHYQHAQGIGMTDEKKENINPQFYTSEIKVLERKTASKVEPQIEVLQFRSNSKTKNYNTVKNVSKSGTKPVVVNYSVNRTNNNSTPTKSYKNTAQSKTYSSINNRGGNSGIKNTVTTTSNLRGSSNIGNGGEIVKETTTQVKMGNRSQFQNKSKPIVITSTEKKVYNQNNFFKK